MENLITILLPETNRFFHVLGWLAFFIRIIGEQLKTARQMRGANIAGASLGGSHYLGLSSYSAALLCVIAALRSLLLMFPRIFVYKKYVGIIAIIACAIVTGMSYTKWFEVFAFIGLATGTLADIQHRAIFMRANNFISNVSWIIFNILLGSPAGLTSAIFGLSSNLIGAWRHHFGPYMRTRSPDVWHI